MVADFVSQTGCDLLAVAVGNVHGLDIEPKVDSSIIRADFKNLSSSTCHAWWIRNSF